MALDQASLGARFRPRFLSPAKRQRKAAGFLLGVFILILLIAVPFLFFDEQVKAGRDSFFSIAGFLAIGTFALVEMILDARRRPFSMNMVHWTFVLIFFSVAPLAQHLAGVIPATASTEAQANGPTGLWDRYYQLVNFLLLGWCVAYSAAYHLIARKMGGPAEQTDRESVRVNPLMAGLAAAGAFLLLVAYLRGSVFGLRGDRSNFDAVSSLGFATFLQTSVRVAPFAAFLILLQTKPRSAAYYPVLLITGIIGLALVNPLSVARMTFAAAVIALIATFLRRRQVSGLWLPISFCLAMFTLMPVLNLARGSSIEEGVKRVKIETPARRLQNGDFDAYAMFVNTAHYVHAGPGARNGVGIGSALLFAVPRTVWPDRSRGSGIDIAEYYHMGFTNLSCPLPAEGYFDFGTPGLLAFAALSGFSLGALDRAFWRRDRQSPSLWLRAAYMQLLGWVFIVMRGSLTPILDYAFAVGATYIVVTFFVTRGIHERTRPLGSRATV